jgi:hypothetical protein
MAMNRAIRFAFTLLTTSTVAALSGAAWADPPSAKTQPVYVLTLSTDDADDQAEALTMALRSRIRQAQGWSLLETPQSFDTLSIALKCPPKPDAPCLQRIADQLHADRFVWGTLSKGGAGQVKADLHMWSRGKPDVEVTDTYSDNLKEASDEALKGITLSMLGKLTGGALGMTGAVTVHAGSGEGDVVVDGITKGRLEGGLSHLDLPPGPHTISVRVSGSSAPSQSTTVSAGGNADLTFDLSSTARPDTGPHTPFPTRKVVEIALLVLGVGALVVSGVEAGQWANYNSEDNGVSHNWQGNNPCSVQPGAPGASNAAEVCQLDKDARTASAIAFVSGGVGAVLVGTGIYLLVTDHPSSESDAAAARASAKPSFDVLPSLGPQGGSMDLRFTF